MELIWHGRAVVLRWSSHRQPTAYWSRRFRSQVGLSDVLDEDQDQLMERLAPLAAQVDAHIEMDLGPPAFLLLVLRPASGHSGGR